MLCLMTNHAEFEVKNRDKNIQIEVELQISNDEVQEPQPKAVHEDQH